VLPWCYAAKMSPTNPLPLRHNAKSVMKDLVWLKRCFHFVFLKIILCIRIKLLVCEKIIQKVVLISHITLISAVWKSIYTKILTIFVFLQTRKLKFALLNFDNFFWNFWNIACSLSAEVSRFWYRVDLLQNCFKLKLFS